MACCVVRPVTLTLIAVTLSTVGCGRSGDPDVLLGDYVARIERVTEVDVLDEAYRPALLAYPHARDRRLPLADVRIGMLDFLALIRCDMQEIVGERNSTLGKVMPVSQQLIYEHRVLVSARRCRQQLDGGLAGALELARKLDDVVEVKTADLPRAYWNATFGSPEFEHMFSLAAAPLAVKPAAQRSNSDIEQALRYLADLGGRLGDVSLELHSARLEAHYQALYARRMAGQVLGALDLLRFYLERAATAIETRLADRPVCYQGRTTPKARILDNVFRKHYVANVQPYLARVHSEARSWLTLVNRLGNAQRAQMTPAFSAYYDAQLSMTADTALWRHYERALRRHTKAWQDVLGQCGLMPGRP